MFSKPTKFKEFINTHSYYKNDKMAKSVKFGQKAPFFMPQLKIKVGDLYQLHLFFKEGVVISNLIVFQEAVVISSYLNFNKIWKKCHFPIKAHAKSAFFGYLNVIVCTAKTRSMTYWFFCLIWVRRWYTLQRSDLYTSVVIHKWDQHTSLIKSNFKVIWFFWRSDMILHNYKCYMLHV